MKWISRGSHQTRSVKKVFLAILQNPQENTCARVSFFTGKIICKYERTDVLHFFKQEQPRRHRTYIERTQDVQKTSWTSSEGLVYVQFTSCVYGAIVWMRLNILIFWKFSLWKSSWFALFSTKHYSL